LESQTRNLEFTAAFARTLPQADMSRLSLVCLNFDGLAALNWEMRNMGAAAIVSLDGWEGKTSGEDTISASHYYNVQRVRAPYLLFVQHELSPPPGLARTDSAFDSLRYAQREVNVIEGMKHGHYVLHSLTGPVAPEKKAEIQFILTRVADWLDAYVKRDTAAANRLKTPPDGIRFVHRRQEAALEPVPLEDEVEEMVMSGGIRNLTAIYRRAVQANPSAVLFGPQTLDLFAFRFDQRGDVDTAIAIEQLRTEAFPVAWYGWNRLAELLEKAGKKTEAIASVQKAVDALDADATVNAARKADLRRRLSEWKSKLAPQP
jgi:hypothetical protein